MAEPAIRVTTEDLTTGDSDREVNEIGPGEFLLTVSEPLYLDGVVRYVNGTVVLTLKRRKDGG